METPVANCFIAKELSRLTAKTGRGFRPKSYWAETDPLSAILRNVTGENRRQMITDYWASGRIDELDISILQDEIDDDTHT